MIGYCPLASGSKGNCIYVGTPHCKILIDAGISTRQIKLKLAEINVDISEIDAILITHDHADHIQGLKVISYNLGIPILANTETAKGIVNHFHAVPKFKIFSTGETFSYSDLEIHPFSIQHDTVDPVAFTLRLDDIKLGICADLGFVTRLVQNHLQDCDYLYIESNHQPSMVHSCARPMVYKQRVLGRSGHLSNEACGQLLTQVAHSGLKHVHLAHLSSECNSPEVALKTINSMLSEKNMQLDLSIAHQDRVSKSIKFL